MCKKMVVCVNMLLLNETPHMCTVHTWCETNKLVTQVMTPRCELLQMCV